MRIFCLIPAYNEKGNLVELSRRLISTLVKEKISFKIFFVIQGDKDAYNLLENLKKTYPQIDYIYFPQPLGIGRAYQIGFQHINKAFTHVLTLDADLNHQPEELPKFLAVWKKSAPDIIIGSRFVPGGKFQDQRAWKKVTSFLVNLVITKFLGIKVHDVTSGYKLIKREVVENIKDHLKETGYPSYMEFMLQAKKSGFKIKEVPINYVPRKWGKSKMGKIKTFLNYLFFLPKALLIFKNPN